jgi:hypothetical protein
LNFRDVNAWREFDKIKDQPKIEKGGCGQIMTISMKTKSLFCVEKLLETIHIEAIRLEGIL